MSAQPAQPSPRGTRPGWTFLTNHGMALIFIARRPDSTVREVAEWVGVSERSTARILADLRSAGYLEATRRGRRNSYRVDLNRRLRHPATSHRKLGDLLAGLLDDPDLTSATRETRGAPSPEGVTERRSMAPSRRNGSRAER